MALDLNRIRDAVVERSPYPYFTLSDSLLIDTAGAIAADFPTIDQPGALSANEVPGGPAFERLLEELRGDTFRQLIAEKFDLDLDGKEVVINVRGKSRWSDGNIHTDTPSKLITVLLYFNAPGEATDTTGLRILKNDHDLDDFEVEVPPVLGNMVAFKVTPDCWHGFKPYSGDRLSLQLNYLSGLKTTGKHEGGRRFFRHIARRGFGARMTLQAEATKAERNAGALWLATWDKRTPWYAKLFAGLAALFALSPLDLSPDFIPVIGYFDDVILLGLGMLLTAKLIPAPLMAEFRRRAMTVDYSRARRGALAIGAMWFAAFGLAAARANGFG